MKTQQEYQLYYWGPHYDMVMDYNAKHGCDVKPWECVKLGNDPMEQHPVFDFPVDSYAFSLTILYDDKLNEHRPVFVGNRLYLNGDEFVVGRSALIHEDRFSWNPPEPEHTFSMEEDVEILNQVCWKFVETYSKPIDSHLFDNLKPVLREVLKEYNKLTAARDKG